MLQAEVTLLIHTHTQVENGNKLSLLHVLAPLMQFNLIQSDAFPLPALLCLCVCVSNQEPGILMKLNGAFFTPAVIV